MAPQKTEIKVGIYCSKCKAQVLKAVAKLPGVDQVSVDGEKGIVTVIGEVDPVCVTTRIRKTGKVAEIISVGPPQPKPQPQPQPQHQPPPEPDIKPLPHCCPQCQVIAINYEPYDRPCNIL